MASADVHGHVIYVGTCRRSWRLACAWLVVAPDALLARMASERALIDRQGDWVLEHAVADLLEEARSEARAPHAPRLRREARGHLRGHRSMALGAVSYRKPLGGLASGCIRKSMPTPAGSRLAKVCIFKRGGLYARWRACPLCAVRVCMLNERELTVAVRRLAQVV